MGQRADCCLFDPDQRWLVDAETLTSRGKNTPWLGKELRGKVQTTLVGGKVVHSGRKTGSTPQV